MNFKKAKSEFEHAIEGAMEDSPSRQMARQKLQHVRSLGNTGSPLYRAALEEMAGGLGQVHTCFLSLVLKTNTIKGKRRPQNVSILLNRRKVPRKGLQNKSLYHLLKLWSTDNGTPLISEPIIDVYNLPPVPVVDAVVAPVPSHTPKKKRAAVEALLKRKSSASSSSEELLQDVVKHAKQRKVEVLKELEDREQLYDTRLSSLEEKTNVKLTKKV